MGKFLAVRNNNRSFLWAIQGTHRIKPQPFLKVVEKGFAYRDRYAAGGHRIVLRHNRLLTSTERRIRGQDNRKGLIPENVLLGCSAGFTITTNFEASR